jgi:hypothetical protein
MIQFLLNGLEKGRPVASTYSHAPNAAHHSKQGENALSFLATALMHGAESRLVLFKFKLVIWPLVPVLFDLIWFFVMNVSCNK